MNHARTLCKSEVVPGGTAVVPGPVSLSRMGRAGSKPRKGKKPQHLPKVGTPQAERQELHGEQRAVMANMGLHSKGAVFWIGVVAVIAIVVIGMLAWIFAT